MSHLRIGRDLAGFRDAAHLDDVRLDYLNCSGIHQSGKIEFAGLGLEAGNGHARMARELGAARNILGLGRLLEPAHLQILECCGVGHRCLMIERRGGITHQVQVGTEGAPRRLDPLDILAEGHPQRRFMQRSCVDRAGNIADLHLEAEIALLARASDIVGKIRVGIASTIIT